MKSRCTLILLAALTLALTSGPALAWDEAKLKSEAQALLDQAAAGMAQRDVAAITASALPQTVFKYRNGQTMTLDQWREAMTRDLADMENFSARFVVERAWPRGKDQAGVLYRERHQFTRPSDPGHRYAIQARFRAHLTKTPQGWRFQEFQDLGITFTRDGKPIKEPGPAQETSPAQSRKPGR